MLSTCGPKESTYVVPFPKGNSCFWIDIRPNVIVSRCYKLPCSKVAKVSDGKPEIQGIKTRCIDEEVDRIGAMLRKCSNEKALLQGKRIHQHIIESGLQRNRYLSNLLVQMYGKCGALEAARHVFDDMRIRNSFSWNLMIGAYIQHGKLKDALRLFQKTPYRDVITWTAMVVAYAKSGQIENALLLFLQMPKKDVVAWNAMISCYVQQGLFEEAFEIFNQMQLEDNIKLDKVTFINVLDACAKRGILAQGQAVHRRLLDFEFQSHVIVGTALIDMYAKCGNVEDARRVFDKMPQYDVILFTAMIAAYAQHGKNAEVLLIFQKMQIQGLVPDEVTFASVLFAYGHAGFINEGAHCFVTISGNRYSRPSLEHYSCVADFLSRAGWLDEAEALINSMPFHPVGISWTGLLGSCRVHVDVNRGKRVAQYVFELDPKKFGTICTSIQHFASNIYNLLAGFITTILPI